MTHGQDLDRQRRELADVLGRLRFAAEPLADDVTVDLRGCARCLGDGHPGLTFERLTYPIELDHEPDLTHWAACPTTGEPIVMRIVAGQSPPIG